MNSISVFIPNNLTESESEDIFDTLGVLAHSHIFHFSFYRTSQVRLLEFLLELPEYLLPKVNLHFISTHEFLPDEILEVVYYLRSIGVNLKDHNFPVGLDQIASDTSYIKFVSNITELTDETISFYKRDEFQISKLLKPLDMAKSLNKRAFMYDLDKDKKIKEI